MSGTWNLTTVRGRRAFLIDLCRRRQRPGTGSDMRALMERGPWMNWPDLSDVLGPIPWAVIDAVATRRYMPERATQDLDVLIEADRLNDAEQRLRAGGWQQTGRLSIGGSIWRSPEGVELDLVGCAEPWCEAAITEAQANRDRQGLPVLPLPYLVLTKLHASRGRDIGDLTQMLGLADDTQCRRVRDVVRQHSPEDLDDVEALIELGKLEIGS